MDTENALLRIKRKLFELKVNNILFREECTIDECFNIKTDKDDNFEFTFYKDSFTDKIKEKKKAKDNYWWDLLDYFNNYANSLLDRQYKGSIRLVSIKSKSK